MRGVVLLALKMGQDLVGGVLILDVSAEFDRPTVVAFRVSVQHALDWRIRPNDWQVRHSLIRSNQ